MVWLISSFFVWVNDHTHCSDPILKTKKEDQDSVMIMWQIWLVASLNFETLQQISPNRTFWLANTLKYASLPVLAIFSHCESPIKLTNQVGQYYHMSFTNGKRHTLKNFATGGIISHEYTKELVRFCNQGKIKLQLDDMLGIVLCGSFIFHHNTCNS